MNAPDNKGDRMSFFAELKRRNVYKVAADFPRIDRVHGYD
jgi:hypothetical protein